MNDPMEQRSQLLRTIGSLAQGLAVKCGPVLFCVSAFIPPAQSHLEPGAPHWPNELARTEGVAVSNGAASVECSPENEHTHIGGHILPCPSRNSESTFGGVESTEHHPQKCTLNSTNRWSAASMEEPIENASHSELRQDLQTTSGRNRKCCKKQGQKRRTTPLPCIHAPEYSDSGERSVQIGCVPSRSKIFYRIDAADWLAYNGAIRVWDGAVIEARAKRGCLLGSRHSRTAYARITQVDSSFRITLQSSFAPEFAADGAESLIDGLRGGADPGSGAWQGFQGQDIVASIDLGSPLEVGRLGISMLQYADSLIWYPTEVEFATSANGRQWSSTVVLNTDTATISGAPRTQELWTDPLQRRARYIVVTARNIGNCPPEHPRAGKPSWLLADEILIKLQ